MRLWTVHPRYLDAKGLVAAWREGLLAQKVLAGGTKGYRHHPQLVRFQAQAKPLAVMASFLEGIVDEAGRRGYSFDTTKISRPRFQGQVEETQGQLLYEWEHLKTKLQARAPELHKKFKDVLLPEAHPLFRIVPGGIQDWEKR